MLEGTLESFTLSDIFKLLASTRKSGCLQLRREPDVGQVYFDQGQVYYALSTSGQLALGRRLVGAGLLSTEAVRQALKQQREARQDTGRALRIGRILVELGEIDQDTLEVFVREQIQDVVFDLMRWTEGAFSFQNAGPDAAVDEPVELSVSVDNLIMEGSRRLEEWEEVRRRIPTLDATVAMSPVAGSSGLDLSLTADEWRLLTMVDGRRRVRDFVELFGQGEFLTCKTLNGLAEAGLVEVRDPETDGTPSVSDLLAQQELLRDFEAEESTTPERDDVTGAADPAGTGLDEGVAGPAVFRLAGDVRREPRQDPAPQAAAGPTSHEAAPEDDVELPLPPAGAEPPAAEHATAGAGNGTALGGESEARLTTDPAVSADLVRRLIDGVKGL